MKEEGGEAKEEMAVYPVGFVSYLLVLSTVDERVYIDNTKSMSELAI